MNKFLFALAGAALLTAPTMAQDLTAAYADDEDFVYADPIPTNVVHPIWSQNATIYEVNTRQYTPEGTFEAFSAHLPRLKDLGVDILWFMPIHPISEKNRKGTLGSYYAVKDYKGVNPEFGDLNSFKKVVDQAHAMGMKVIIDWVPNHTGCDNAWVTEHPDWYKKNEKGEMYGPFDWTDVYQLDYSNPEMRKGMIDALSYWLREVGIDGFRCDVAGMVPVDFWDEARVALENVKGEGNLFMLAEAPDPELMENAFDMDYNWPMKDLQNAIAYAKGQYTFVKPGETAVAKLPEKDVIDLQALVEKQYFKYPAGSIMMNMVTNHDLNSWEGTEYQRYGKFLPAMTVLTYVLPGMPLIYSGQEAALNRALEFFEKDCITEFDNLNDPTSQASKMTQMLSVLNEIKATNPDLAAGVTTTGCDVLAGVNGDAIIYRRNYGEDEVTMTDTMVYPIDIIPMETVAYFNFSNEPAEFEYVTPENVKWAWLFGDFGVKELKATELPTKLNSGEALLLRQEVVFTQIMIIDSEELEEK